MIRAFMTQATQMDFLPHPLLEAFGERIQRRAPLARYTSARIGGEADALLAVEDTGELALAASLLWEAGAPFSVLGGGSNVLVSDKGLRGVVLLNKARQVRFEADVEPPFVDAESGANFGAIARLAAAYGLSGLEWAANIPGTLGGAVVGNAGAFGGDMAGSLVVAEILHPVKQSGLVEVIREKLTVDRLGYSYRSSFIKEQNRRRKPGETTQPGAVVLSARLRLEHSTPESVQAKMEANNERRRASQPPGASMGSMFKNPPGDYAGRLIEACDLKGTRVGNAQISPVHANFFNNLGGATAMDVLGLIELAQRMVAEQFGVNLELEIELVGEW